MYSRRLLTTKTIWQDKIYTYNKIYQRVQDYRLPMLVALMRENSCMALSLKSVDACFRSSFLIVPPYLFFECFWATKKLPQKNQITRGDCIVHSTEVAFLLIAWRPPVQCSAFTNVYFDVDKVSMCFVNKILIWLYYDCIINLIMTLTRTLARIIFLECGCPIRPPLLFL